jgi:hypothetical protein
LSYLLKRGRDLEATFLSPTATLLFPAHRSGVNVPGLLLTSPSTASLARSAAISPPGLSRELAGRLYNRNPLPAPSAPPPEVLSIRRSPPGFHPSGSKHPNEPALRRTYLRIRPISLRSPPADFYSNRRIIVPSPLRFLRIAAFATVRRLAPLAFPLPVRPRSDTAHSALSALGSLVCLLSLTANFE